MLDVLKKITRNIIHKVRITRRIATLKHSKPHVTSKKITDDLQKMGIHHGDILFIHSSLKSIGYLVDGPNTVINGILDAVGPEGTLLLPSYYLPGGSIHGACQINGYVFDPRVHGSNMGALPEAVLKFRGVCRSIHPTHSVSAIGKHAQYLTETHHLAPSIFGKDSPWQRFHELDGKVFGIGISMGPVTFYHLLEDTLEGDFSINVWEDTLYRIPCKGWNGENYLVPVRPFRSDLASKRIDHKSREDLRQFMWEYFSSSGTLHTGKIGDASSWYIQASDFLTHLIKLHKKGITIYSDAEDIRRIL